MNIYTIGFQGPRNTPVEIIHIILLGIVKYMFRELMVKMTPSQKSELMDYWQSFKTSGPNTPPVQPKTMVQHFGGLIGKEFRTIVQAAPFVLFKHMSTKKRHMCTALCHFCSTYFELKYQTWHPM